MEKFMKQIQFTTSQFAKLHNVNKRTLHYYDSIQLFSPHTKKENGYRYYDLSQSMDFEYIRMLKELHMSIEEIQAYMQHPNPQDFINIANTKIKEIDQEIQKLTNIKSILENKKKDLETCQHLPDIQIEELDEQQISTIHHTNTDDISNMFSYIQDKWPIEQIRNGIGTFISIDKLQQNHYEYDGLYSPSIGAFDAIKPKGTYLCAYHKGNWDHTPHTYKKMFAYAKKHDLILEGYAYEIGINEFAIQDEEEYITKIMIKIACHNFHIVD